ncbi:MAG: class I SAM-dependent methyltransferase [Acidobacteriota bacterium]
MADPAPTRCKVCGAHDANLAGVVDFAKSCEDRNGLRLPVTGSPIYYRRCGQCGFLFTDAFDHWDREDFLGNIYNQDYGRVDPDYAGARAAANAAMVRQLFGGSVINPAALDYGGGDGSLARILGESGFAVAHTYDPFVPEHATPPARRYNLVTCFEVLEHTPTPMETAAAIASFLDDDSMILASTLLQPAGGADTDWWYVAPRNGHVSLHTSHSLAHMWNSLGLSVGTLSDGFHVAFRKTPSFWPFGAA